MIKIQTNWNNEHKYIQIHQAPMDLRWEVSFQHGPCVHADSRYGQAVSRVWSVKAPSPRGFLVQMAILAVTVPLLTDYRIIFQVIWCLKIDLVGVSLQNAGLSKFEATIILQSLQQWWHSSEVLSRETCSTSPCLDTTCFGWGGATGQGTKGWYTSDPACYQMPGYCPNKFSSNSVALFGK